MRRPQSLLVLFAALALAQCAQPSAPTGGSAPAVFGVMTPPEAPPTIR